MKKKIMLTAVFLCIGILSVPLGGCKKKDDESTAIAITPTPSDKSEDEPTATPVPTISANDAAGISGNTTSPGGISGNSAISGNTAANGAGNKITGTIVAASMNDVTVRTSEGAEYVCSTTGAVNNLSNGITLGNNITVTLASMSAVNNVYTATELNDISSAAAGNSGTDGSGTGTGLAGENTEGSGDGTDLYGTDTYGTDTYGYDETYESYDDGSGDYTYDDDSGDYYYYDPATEYYDESYAY